MGKILKYWPKEEIIKALKALPKDKPINYNTIQEYHKNKLICDYSCIGNKFGSLREACNIAGIRCDSKIYYDKEKLKKVLIDSYKKYGIMIPTNFVLKINNENHTDIRQPIKKYYKIIKNALEDCNITYKNYYWTDKRIIKTLKQLNKEYGPLYKTQINSFRKKKMICGSKLIKDRFKTINNAARLAGFKFVEPKDKGHLYNGKIGRVETEILDKIEKEKKIKIIRQYRIQTEQNVFFVDGYDKNNNIIYEIDEKYHKYDNQIAVDSARENEIISYLNCEIKRIKV